MGNAVTVYLIYIAISVVLTVCLAAVLFRSGGVVLADAFKSRVLAEAVNRLLVIGFFMLSLGYTFIIFRTSSDLVEPHEAVEVLVQKLGIVLLSLGAIHTVNTLSVYGIRQRSKVN